MRPALSAARYRAAPRYSITAAGPSSGAAAAAGSEDALLTPDPDWPRPIRSVTRSTAALFQALGQPRSLPHPVPAADLARLVLDGVLQVEWRDQWHTGPAAHGLYFDGTAPPLGNGPIARLSRAALEYGSALHLRLSGEVAGRLYRWHAMPDTPAWRQRLPTEAAVAAFLGVDQAMLTAGLREVSTHRPAWREWAPPEPSALGDGGTIYKLYLSPAPAATPAALARLLPELPHIKGLLGLKLSRQRPALLRPDKVLLYFSGLDALRDAAARITPALSGIPAHGVPFTASLDETGLLSWGADPPSAQGDDDTSWRVWLCERLASALALAELSGDAPVPAWHFALDRLTLDGVDVASWAPVHGQWDAAGLAPHLPTGADGSH